MEETNGLRMDDTYQESMIDTIKSLKFRQVGYLPFNCITKDSAIVIAFILLIFFKLFWIPIVISLIVMQITKNDEIILRYVSDIQFTMAFILP